MNAAGAAWALPAELLEGVVEVDRLFSLPEGIGDVRYKGVLKELRCCWPTVWVYCEAQGKEITSDGRDVVGQRRTSSRLGNLKHCCPVVVCQLGPGVLAREHFNNGASNRPDVCPAAIAYALDDLWSHPEYRSSYGLHAICNR